MNITVTKREALTKGQRKQRLRQGLIPASVYGRGLEPQSVEIDAKSVAQVLLSESGMNTIINLKIKGDSKAHTVLIDSLERDPLTRGFRNVGFHQVKKGDKVTAQIPIQLIGIPADVASNVALLDQQLGAITVHADPTKLPSSLDVDVSALKAGESLRVADLPHNPDVEFTTGEDVVIVMVQYSTTAQAVEESDTAAEEAQPTGENADSGSDSVTDTASA
ncbi:MAG: 50S ribosomal protein L25 [Armatimonadota bacterium]|nr:50S ribosomal protein L25 [Armatimonadota bacterium]